MKTPELMERLRRHYIKPGDWPGGVFVPECGWNGATGGRVDALYVGFTSTSGRRLIGHEVKVSRADWRHELAQQGKADPWHDQCHAWYVVAPGEDVVPREELPAGWGLMVPGGSRTRMKVVQRPEFRDVTPSWDAMRSVLSRVDTLQQQQTIRAREDVAQRERTVAAREQALTTAGEHSLGHDDQQLLEWARRLRDEHKLDLQLFSWRDQGVSPEQFAAGLRLARAADAMTAQRAEYVYRQLRDTAQHMLEGLEEFKAAEDALRKLGGHR